MLHKKEYEPGTLLIWKFGPLPNERMKVQYKRHEFREYVEVEGVEGQYKGGKYTARVQELTPCRNLPEWF